ncbi:FAD-binding oxidoreductase [Bradyrhizobium sp. 182]|uniref:NAD(P)/FAD-dependent oxidoreductase n=1 Tax=unclassified Bradyrhizobium TaxID=2631580 RepID=UPI001FF795D0|nr:MULTISPECIES: FAD-binding oxidoreductase [unclassified Bradyrhizobium]MCK1424867.1 FAD-binding oxidoreductase [Bradyrhizobium sp. CW12]MCK1531897.1 FAD-binding oxidoreductase [Bradyrhizobium sp. 182]MCK1646548.1 FAD-binding oxidoreductase [Bradyrhizobium sp. 154]MCK1667902.1 FAD-binding oxidoreductase [Bradyrhizobium sp. 153]
MTRDFSTLPSVNSLWEATADPARAFPVLSGESQADVVIIGAGYTGLSAAHHIAKSGLSPVVLEANRPGWGASGRNGGVITAKFRLSFREIDALHGRDMARRMYEIAHESTDMVEELVSEFGITSANLVRTGQVKAAHNEATLKAAIDEANWMTREMGSAAVRILDKNGVREETGSDIFVGGVLNPGSGGVHPLNYLRGLANGVASRGVPIFQESPVVKLRREKDGIVAETPQGAVRAKQAIIATNSYSDLTDATVQIQRTLIPFRSAIIATEQLPRNLAGKLMPTGRTYTETKRMMRWFRMVDNRVIFGGRGAFGKQDSQAAFDALRKAMVGIFPDLADVPLAYKWSGLVAMTLDSVPHIGRLDDRTLFSIGYNGAGVAMSSLMGRYLAAFVRGETPDVGLLDARRMKAIPFYPLREPAVRMVAGWYQFLDAIGQ